MKKLLFCTIFITLSITVCAQIPPTHSDIDYVGDGSEKHLLDIYIPPIVTEPAPIIIWIHGGAWLSGSKGGAFRKCDSLYYNGYILADINYRYSSDSIFPAQIYDCKAAIRYLKAHCDEYHIDTNRVAVAGSSAGGHLVAFLGATNGIDSLENFDLGNAHVSSDVHAVCDFYGATDFLQMNDNVPLTPPDSCESWLDHELPSSPESRLLGCFIFDCPERFAYANPISYLDSNDPPYIIFHGTYDCTVPCYQSILLDSALAYYDIPHELYLIDHAGHGAMPEFDWETQKHRMRAFFDDLFFPEAIVAEQNTILSSLSMQIAPNPFNRRVNIELNESQSIQIFDVLGNEVYRTFGNIASWQPGENHRSGMYFVKAESNTGLSQIEKIYYMK